MLKGSLPLASLLLPVSRPTWVLALLLNNASVYRLISTLDTLWKRGPGNALRVSSTTSSTRTL